MRNTKKNSPYFTVRNISEIKKESPSLLQQEPRSYNYTSSSEDYFSRRSLSGKKSFSRFSRSFFGKKQRRNPYSSFLQSKKSQALLLSFLSITGGIFMLSDNGNIFKASFTDQPSPITFDGTVYPYQQAPDWFSVGGKNNLHYSEYKSSQLIPAPRYDTSILKKDGWIREWVNPQITYSIVYMGKYIFDHKEYTGSHPAVDIKLAPGTPVFAIANGIVVKSQSLNTGYGQHIVVRHDGVPEHGTVYSSYSHLSNRIVRVGDTVRKGQQVGLVGSSGNSTTAHIHFQVDKKGAPFYPYWPFSSSDANNAGYSFTSAVNAGFGRDNALQYTLHPFDFIHKYENKTITSPQSVPETLHASAPTSKPSVSPVDSSNTSSSIPSNTQQSLGGFRIEASPIKILSGERVRIGILAANQEGNFFETFNESVTISYPYENKIKTEEVIVDNGEGEAILRLSDIGSNTVRVSHNDTVESIKIKVVKPQTKDVPIVASTKDELVSENIIAENNSLNTEVETQQTTEPTKQIEEENTPIVFSQLQISGPHKAVKGTPISLIIRAIDENGETIESSTFPNRGGFIISSKNGSTNILQLKKGSFTTGTAVVEFFPETIGMGFILIDDKKHEISISDPEVKKQTEQTLESQENIFTDISTSHPHAKAIAYLKSQGIVNGYADGSFQPDKKVNRGEALKMIFSALSISLYTNEQSSFSDVSSDDWFSGYVLTAYKKGIVNGYSDGTFRPEKTVNRSEYFKILLNSSEVMLQGIPSKSPFSDVPRTSWFAEYAQYAKTKSLLDFKNNFFPTTGVSRAEVAESIYRLLR